mgnify:CR=1 FL=1
MPKMIRNVLSSLFKKPATAMYPVKKREWYAATRGHIEIDQDRCILCGICSRKCPASAITIDKTARTWTIDRMACVQCGYCAESCPKQCLTVKNEYTAPDTVKVTYTVTVPAKPKVPTETPSS